MAYRREKSTEKNRNVSCHIYLVIENLPLLAATVLNGNRIATVELY